MASPVVSSIGSIEGIVDEGGQLSYASLRVGLRGLRSSDSTLLRQPQVFLRLGPTLVKTTRRLPEAPWSENFDFGRISYHEHLFWHIQIDLYDCRTLLPAVHIGRARLRLSRLDLHSTGPITRWCKLWSKHEAAVAEIADLGLLSEEEHELIGRGAPVGEILVKVRYKVAALETMEAHIAEMFSELRLESSSTNVESTISSRQCSVSTPSLLPSQSQETDFRTGDSSSPSEDSIATLMDMSEALDLVGSGRILDSPTSSALINVDSNHKPSDQILQEDNDLAHLKEELAGTQRINTFLHRLSGWVFREAEDLATVQRLLDMLVTFGQGFGSSGRLTFTLAFLLLQRYYNAMPAIFNNNLILKKSDLELPRAMFKYSMAALGWSALQFFGKRRNILADALQSQANRRAVLEYLELQQEELLACDLDDNKLFRPNYIVCHDKKLSAIILAVRGTMSLRDTLTDLSCDYVPFKGAIAHSGMLRGAQWFLANVAPLLIEKALLLNAPNIYLTGHSLGGATSALLAIMLSEQLPKEMNFNVKCISFGTPAVLSRSLAKSCGEDDLVNSFIFGEDIVPRLSYGTVCDLKLLLVYVAKIATSGDLLRTGEMDPNSELYKRIDQFRLAIKALPASESNPKLYIPGKVHHVISMKAPNHTSQTLIDSCKADRFTELILRKNMLLDHLPNRYEGAFDDAYVTFLMQDLERRQTGSFKM